MANPPYFTTHFDLAFPLPILFFRWWFSSSPEHFYDEWFDLLRSWPQKQSMTKGDTISLILGACGMPNWWYRYFKKITVFTLEMENFKFQLNSGEISANFSCENLFFYIFPEMISSYLMVYLGRASWVNIYSTFILDRGLNSCRVTCYGPRS